MKIKKVMKYPVEATIKIYFGKLINQQEFQIRNRYHLISVLNLGLALGNEKAEFPNKVEIYDNKERLIGFGEIKD